MINKAHTKRGKRSIRIPRARIFQIVEIKFTEPAKDEAPAKCKLNIAKSTDFPECANKPDKGG